MGLLIKILHLGKTDTYMTDYKEGDLLRDPTTNQPLKLFGLEKTEMVFVEKGNFIMGEGSNTTEINFEEGYFIGKYPVTQELYEKVMGNNPSRFKGKYRPVESVSWNDICERKNSFLSELNDKIQKNVPPFKGKGDFKLPSEAQWEYAAKSGKRWDKPNLKFAGSQNTKDVAWYKENSNNETKPIGLKQPNLIGLYDMSGNVWEWCEDFRIEDRNLKLIPRDGIANFKFGTLRALRGGSCFDFADRCCVAYRSHSGPDRRHNNIGFRLVCPQFNR